MKTQRLLYIILAPGIPITILWDRHILQENPSHIFQRELAVTSYPLRTRESTIIWDPGDTIVPSGPWDSCYHLLGPRRFCHHLLGTLGLPSYPARGPCAPVASRRPARPLRSMPVPMTWPGNDLRRPPPGAPLRRPAGPSQTRNAAGLFIPPFFCLSPIISNRPENLTLCCAR